MFTVPAQVKDTFAPFKDDQGHDAMVIPFLKEVTRVNQISMKLGCAGVALDETLLGEAGIVHPKDIKTTLENSAYIFKRCKCWYAALEEM